MAKTTKTTKTTTKARMGRPPKPDAERLVPVAVRLDANTLERLDALAERLGVKRRALARECLLDGLERAEKGAAKGGRKR